MNETGQGELRYRDYRFNATVLENSAFAFPTWLTGDAICRVLDRDFLLAVTVLPVAFTVFGTADHP